MGAELLDLLGAAEAGTLFVSIGAQDEFRACLESIPVAAKSWERQLADAAKQRSYSFTIRLLDDLVGLGELEYGRMRELRKGLNAGELTAKDVRDMAVAEAKREKGVEHVNAQLTSHLQNVKQHVHNVGSVLQLQEKDRQYSEMVARENYEGLMAAAKRQG